MLPPSLLSFLHEGSDLYHILNAPQISSGAHLHFLSQAFCLRSFFHVLFWLLLPREHTSCLISQSSPTFCLLPTLFCIHSVKTYCQEDDMMSVILSYFFQSHLHTETSLFEDYSYLLLIKKSRLSEASWMPHGLDPALDCPIFL